MFKVNKKKKKIELGQWRRSGVFVPGVFIVNFELFSQLFLVFLLLSLIK